MRFNIIQKLAGTHKAAPPPVAEEADEKKKPDQQSADVAIAAQRVNQKADEVRATLAELLKANDGPRRHSLQGFQ